MGERLLVKDAQSVPQASAPHDLSFPDTLLLHRVIAAVRQAIPNADSLPADEVMQIVLAALKMYSAAKKKKKKRADRANR
jgi:hypothetical protein